MEKEAQCENGRFDRLLRRPNVKAIPALSLPPLYNCAPSSRFLRKPALLKAIHLLIESLKDSNLIVNRHRSYQGL